MTEEQNIKLQCLKEASGDLESAKQFYEWLHPKPKSPFGWSIEVHLGDRSVGCDLNPGLNADAINASFQELMKMIRHEDGHSKVGGNGNGSD